jgi:hypothetical protein
MAVNGVAIAAPQSAHPDTALWRLFFAAPIRADQINMADAQSPRQLVQCDDRRIPSALLQSTDVLLAEPRNLREPFLRQALSLPDALQIPPDQLAHVHEPKLSRLHTLSLSTTICTRPVLTRRTNMRNLIAAAALSCMTIGLAQAQEGKNPFVRPAEGAVDPSANAPCPSGPFMRMPIRCWVGKKFLFMPMTKEFQVSGYDLFRGGSGKFGQPTYAELGGKIATVISAKLETNVLGDPDWKLVFRADDTGKQYTTSGFVFPGQQPDDATVEGIAPLDDLKAARDKWLGKKFYLLKGQLPVLGDSYQNIQFARLKKFTQVTISDVLASNDSISTFTPVRLVVRAPDGREAYADINVSQTNLSPDVRRGGQGHSGFQEYFSEKNPRDGHPWPPSIWSAIENEQVVIGMTAEQARFSWGDPQKINRMTVAGKLQDQWVFRDQKYLYFDNGILTAAQN